MNAAACYILREKASMDVVVPPPQEHYALSRCTHPRKMLLRVCRPTKQACQNIWLRGKSPSVQVKLGVTMWL